MRRFFWFFVAEILAAGAATAVFRLLQPKMLAALWAGGAFVALGLCIVALGVRDTEFRRSWTFRFGCVHLFATSLPMMIARLATYGTEFRDVRILGVPGPAFHHASEAVYLAMLVGTAVDFWRSRRRAAAGILR